MRITSFGNSNAELNEFLHLQRIRCYYNWHISDVTFRIMDGLYAYYA
jgi:hypothetical protein